MTLAALVAELEASCAERCRHLLSLADRSPYSANYGCFDRSYWQYRIKDFPSGMSQESLYPLALALKLGLFPRLSAAGAAELRQLIAAACRFSLQGQHANGSVDDYFPFEQAAGATAFSLYAILEAIGLGQLALPAALLPALRRRLAWLADHRESGRLSNHEALIALCLARAAHRLDDPSLLERALERFERLLSWRSPEGWFEEYGGFDVGYESLTFACLHELAALLPRARERIRRLLPDQARLILAAAEPDGCLGGELFARGTWNLFAHGLLAHASGADPALLPAVGRVLEARFLRYPTAVRDDYVLQHHLWSDLRTLALLRTGPVQAALGRDREPSLVALQSLSAVAQTDAVPGAAAGAMADAVAGLRPQVEPGAAAGPAPGADAGADAEKDLGAGTSAEASTGSEAGDGGGRKAVLVERELPLAGHLWIAHGSCRTHVALQVGGAFRHYRDGRFVVQDTQHAVQVGGAPGRSERGAGLAGAPGRGGGGRTWLAHAPDPGVRWRWASPGCLEIAGRLSPYRPQAMTTAKLILLRLLMLAGGRWRPDAVRALMQRLLIRTAVDGRRRWQRRIRFLDDGLMVEDRYDLAAGEAARAEALPTGFSTYRHVVMSRMFHPYALEQQDPLHTQFGREAAAITVLRRW